MDDQLVGQLGIKHIETKYVPFLSTAIAEFTNKFYNLEFMLSSQIEQQKREEEAAMPKGRGLEPDVLLTVAATCGRKPEIHRIPS